MSAPLSDYTKEEMQAMISSLKLEVVKLKAAGIIHRNLAAKVGVVCVKQDLEWTDHFQRMMTILKQLKKWFMVQHFQSSMIL